MTKSTPSQLTDDQLIALAGRVTAAIETYGLQMLREGSIEIDIASMVASVILQRALVVAFQSGQVADSTHLMAIAYVLGKISEREDWAAEFAPQKEGS